MPLPTPSKTIPAQVIRFKQAGENFPRVIRVGEVIQHEATSGQVLSITVQVWEPKNNVYLGSMVSITITFDGLSDTTFWVPTDDLKYIEQLP